MISLQTPRFSGAEARHRHSEAGGVRLPKGRLSLYGPRWGIVPLGTGNDFSRVAGWGGNNPEGVAENNFELLKSLAWGLRG